MRRRTAVTGTVLVYALTWLVNRSLRRVEGASMRPTLAPGDLVVVAPARLVPLVHGAVVVVHDPRDGRSTIKRVAGLAGEPVQVGGRELRAGRGELVVLGDDPTASTDSRTYGPVPAANVRAVALAAGRPWRSLWPAGARPARRRSRGTPSGR